MHITIIYHLLSFKQINLLLLVLNLASLLFVSAQGCFDIE